MKRMLTLIFPMFFGSLLWAQKSTSFDVRNLENEDGQSIYAFSDSVYALYDTCPDVPRKSAFRLEIDESGTVLSVRILFEEENCRNRAYARILYRSRWKLTSGQKGKTLYLIF